MEEDECDFAIKMKQKPGAPESQSAIIETIPSSL